MRNSKAFTLIELIVVIVILGILSVTAAPRFVSLSSDARLAALDGIASQVRSTITLAKTKSLLSGLRAVPTNPGGPGGVQTAYIVDFGFGSVEVDFRNLCPESRGEGGDQLNMDDFLVLSDDIEVKFSNQYTGIGFDVPNIPGSGAPAAGQGCYVLYDSFGLPDCTVTVVSDDC